MGAKSNLTIKQTKVPEDQLLPDALTSTRSLSGGREEIKVFSEHIQEVAELCQASDEYPLPRGPTFQSDGEHHNENTLSAACYDLGVSQNSMEQLLAQ